MPDDTVLTTPTLPKDNAHKVVTPTITKFIDVETGCANPANAVLTKTTVPKDNARKVVMPVPLLLLSNENNTTPTSCNDNTRKVVTPTTPQTPYN